MSIKESALSVISSITQSDFVRAVTSDGNSRRVTVANLAKAVVESYTGSSLGGSQRSVKAAIDSLNSQISPLYTYLRALSNTNTVDINFSDSTGIFLLLCMDRRSGASPKACLLQKYSGTTNKYAITGGSNWGSTSTSTGMRVTLENTYYTVLAIGNVPFTMTEV